MDSFEAERVSFEVTRGISRPGGVFLQRCGDISRLGWEIRGRIGIL